MIDGVIVKDVVRYPDERGFFNEIARFQDSRVDTGFKQVSHGLRHQGISNGWHIHEKLCEWIYVVSGHARIVLKDCRFGCGQIPIRFIYRNDSSAEYPPFNFSVSRGEYTEIYAGEHAPKAIFVPCGVAHAYKIIQGPCHMVYIASEIYNPSDEGRISWDYWKECDWTREVEVR